MEVFMIQHQFTGFNLLTLLCTNNKFLATSTLMSLLMKAGLSLNVFWHGSSSLYYV